MGMLFKKRVKSDHDIWKTLSTGGQLDDIVAKSKDKVQVIFKHSTRCSISTMAKHRMDKGWDLAVEEADLYYLDLLAYRPVSNLIAEKFGVVHESPQMIVIKDGKVLFHESHGGIDPSLVRQTL
jgi:bacillithiol system protein YtxJ